MTQILLVDASNRARYHHLLEASFRVRHQVFVKERGWTDLDRPDGREIDAYDDEHARYLIAVDQERVVGGIRLYPTTRPHMISDVFPHLAAVKGVPTGPEIIEITRYFVVKERRTGRTDAQLLAAVQEFCLDEGYEAMSAVVEAWWLPRFQHYGFNLRPLGLPALVGGQWTLAVSIDVSEDTVATVRSIAGLKGSLTKRFLTADSDAEVINGASLAS